MSTVDLIMCSDASMKMPLEKPFIRTNHIVVNVVCTDESQIRSSVERVVDDFTNYLYRDQPEWHTFYREHW